MKDGGGDEGDNEQEEEEDRGVIGRGITQLLKKKEGKGNR